MKAFKNYGKKSKKMIRLAVAVKGLTATLGTSTFVMGLDAKYSFGIFLIGAIANEAINFINYEDEESSNNTTSN